MKYKVGDRVRIKSLDWYNKNKDEFNDVLCGEHYFTGSMKKLCSKIFEISNKTVDGYFMLEDKHKYVWTDEMIEGLVEESDDFEKMCMESEKRYEEEYSTGKYCHEQSFKWGFQEGYNYSHENDKLEISLKDGYQFVDENGNVINATKIVLEKKKKEYPKTYCECKDILGLWDIDDTERGYYKTDPIDKLQMLLICRDAYWKIAGEEMGLGKPWEPDWKNYNDFKFVIGVFENEIIKCYNTLAQFVFAFPTEKMRDAFYDNFKEEIEICKELL